MGGEKFDSTHPEGYLFGENSDLNFLGNRPVAVWLLSVYFHSGLSGRVKWSCQNKFVIAGSAVSAAWSELRGARLQPLWWSRVSWHQRLPRGKVPGLPEGEDSSQNPALLGSAPLKLCLNATSADFPCPVPSLSAPCFSFVFIATNTTLLFFSR